MYQAGVKKITLYENKGINFTYYDPLDLNAITDLTGEGNIITIDNESQPKYDIKIKFSDRGNVVYDYKVEFFLLDFTQENFRTLSDIKRSIYGWCPLIEFYDGTYKFYRTPIFCKEASIKPHEELSFEIEMKNKVPSIFKHLDYTAGISTTTIYRADTTLLTADTEIYTADYAL